MRSAVKCGEQPNWKEGLGGHTLPGAAENREPGLSTHLCKKFVQTPVPVGLQGPTVILFGNEQEVMHKDYNHGHSF